MGLGRMLARVDRFLCNLGFHRWTPWTDPVLKGVYGIQYRKCIKCNIQKNHRFREG